MSDDAFLVFQKSAERPRRFSDDDHDAKKVKSFFESFIIMVMIIFNTPVVKMMTSYKNCGSGR